MGQDVCFPNGLLFLANFIKIIFLSCFNQCKIHAICFLTEPLKPIYCRSQKCARNVEGRKMFCIFFGQTWVSKTLKPISTCQRCYQTLIFWYLKTKKKSTVFLVSSSDLTVDCLPLCAKAPLSGGTRSRWLGGPVGFPPPATLLIGKFTSLQGTTDSPVN